MEPASAIGTAEKDQAVFAAAVRYMNRNIHSTVTVESIAKECYVSPAKLKKVFSKYTGEGIITYFINIKLKKAKEYLSSGKSIGETSDLLGFSSQAYFSLWFKKLTGITPFKYKESHINRYRNQQQR